MRYLVPIAAGEDLFPSSDYHFPKPLIEIDGVPMIQRFVENIQRSDPDASFIFMARADHCRRYSLNMILDQISNGQCTVLQLENQTAGALCTALLAIDHINDDKPLVICNGDQILEANLSRILSEFSQQRADAGVITFPSVHPRWSYVRLDRAGRVVEAAEKRVISRQAIAGFYYFAQGSSFVRSAQGAISNNQSLDGIFYISSVLNELVLEGGLVVSNSIDADNYQSLYSPQRVENYERQVQGQRLSGGRNEGRMLTVVIPMAGLGSRFAQEGYAKPKPFIDVAGKTMIERVMDNLKVPNAKFVLIARQEHLEQEPEVVAELLGRGDVEFAPIDVVTEGAACTVLTALRHMDHGSPVLLANCDQIVDFSCDDFLADATTRDLDGSILVFKDEARDPKWSFAKIGDAGMVEEVREKVPISNVATVGLYYFKTARLFIDSAAEMIALNDRVNGEFYVCPVYNYSLAQGARVGVFEVAPDAMHGIGTPSDLTAYLELRYSA
jgi:dTDP-glucose pyrophosphorylase